MVKKHEKKEHLYLRNKTSLPMFYLRIK